MPNNQFSITNLPSEMILPIIDQPPSALLFAHSGSCLLDLRVSINIVAPLMGVTSFS